MNHKINRRSFVRNAGIMGLLSSFLGIRNAQAAEKEPEKETLMSGETSNVENVELYEFTKKIPVGDSYDLVVIGGGPAGAGAAISAARLGAKVLLVEATGCLGGMGTSGLVTAFDPMANGKEMLVGGLMKEIVETLYERKLLKPGINPNAWRKNMHHWTPFQVEGYKLLLDELVTAAGVHLMYFTKAVDVDVDTKKGVFNGVVLHNIEGYRYVTGKTFLDCTGDGVIAKLAGVTCREAGTDTPGIMPATLMSLFSGINMPEFYKGDQHKQLMKAIADGHFTQEDRHLPGMFVVNQTTANLNGGHLFKMNALKCKDLTEGIMLGRKIVQEYKSFYQKYMPGCENIELVITANVIGVRESRRILGEYELNYDDYMERRKFPDQIGLFCKYIDIHPYDTSKEQWERYSSEAGHIRNGTQRSSKYEIGEYFGIPYGILVPKGWKNFWVAGRCASSDVRAHGSIRVQPACSMMGQAVGTAAVQSIKTGQPANDLDTEMLVLTLRKAGAYLPQDSLTKKMTRNET
ncbi:MAG: FAD-dependent oxidoreductase [Planctomycetaceae bacterium]|jgi:hypothetical protein|nr:FAD-dependent oxidoreductase [Planctomycetaceae bacterium]